MSTLVKTTATQQHPVRWFWAGGLIALLGLAAAAIWTAAGVLAAVDAPDRFARTALPGTVAVQLAAGEDQVVYEEGPDTPGPAPLGLRVTGPNGSVVDTAPYRGDLRYDTAGGTGRAIATFHATTAGTYRITASTVAGRGARLAVGPSVARTVAQGLIGPGVLAAAAVVLALVCAAVPFTKPKPTE